jgi:hypothetical protein
LSHRFSLWKHEQRLAGNQIPVHLPYQFAKYPLGAISPNRITEPFAHHDPDAAGRITHPIGQQIEQCRRHPSPMALDRLNVPAGP